MGSKGSQTTTQQQSATMTPSPYVGGAGQAAIQGAEYAAGQPFQMPVAPLAPFTPFQEQGFQQVQGLQGMAQPYFGAGAGYLAGSAAPVTGQDVSGYYNPMAGSVMAGLQDVFGQQMREATGRLTQQAGGVGAGRIPVAQANLAKQQGLAAGQTLAGLYYPALQAAQQQKSMMAGAGYGLAQMGPAAQAAQLQGTQALMGAGGQQQALAQQYMQNLYANRLAQIGYPFQTAQYLAGITGGLAPAMGGTTQGTATTTAPAPSLASQLLGIGTAGLGLYGGMGGFGGKGGGYSPTSAYQTSLGWYQSPAWYNQKRGGRVPTGMKGGGSAPPPLPPPPAPVYSPAPIGRSGEMSAAIPPGGMSTEEAIAEAAPFFKYYGGSGGIPSWATSQIGRMTTPQFQMPSFLSAFMANPFTGALRHSDKYGLAGLIPKVLLNSRQSESEQQPSTFSYPGEGQYIYADGGAVDEEQPDTSAVSMSPMGGPPVPTTGSIVPNIPVQSSGSGFPKLTFSSPSGSSRGAGGDIGKVADIAMKVLPMLMAKRGGRTSVGGPVNPFDVGQPFQEGGDVDNPFTVDQPHLGLGDVLSAAKKFYSPMAESAFNPTEDPIKGIIPRMLGGMRSAPAAVAPIAPSAFQLPQEAPAMPSARPMEASLTDPSAKLPDVYRAGHSDLSKEYGPQVASAIMGNLGVESPTLDPRESHDQGTGIGIAGWRKERRDALYDFAGQNGLDPTNRQTQFAFLKHEINTNPQYSDMLKRMQQAGSPAEAARIFRTEFERPAGTTQGRPLGLNQAQQLATQFNAGNFSDVGAGAAPREVADRPAFADYQPTSFLDRYGPRTRDLDWGQRMARSPWMALVQAGATMAQSTGPIGSVIGAGLSAGAKTLEAQRKALDTEDLIQQKADMLAERAEQHLREYQRKSEYADVRTQIAQEREARLRERETRIKEHAPISYKEALKAASENNPGLLGNSDALHEEAVKIMQRDPTRAGSMGAATPVGAVKSFSTGQYRKIKEGPDSDASTWSKVGA